MGNKTLILEIKHEKHCGKRYCSTQCCQVVRTGAVQISAWDCAEATIITYTSVNCIKGREVYIYMYVYICIYIYIYMYVYICISRINHIWHNLPRILHFSQ